MTYSAAATDTKTSVPVAIVNETFARSFSLEPVRLEQTSGETGACAKRLLPFKS